MKNSKRHTVTLTVDFGRPVNRAEALRIARIAYRMDLIIPGVAGSTRLHVGSVKLAPSALQSWRRYLADPNK